MSLKKLFFTFERFLEKQIRGKHKVSLAINMVFNPGLERNQVIDNDDLCSIFKCSPQSGMRRGLRTNSLVLISNRTNGPYRDVWKKDILLYTGMGLTGDQRIEFAQNKTLNESQTNGVKVYLFEVLTKGQYTYRGEVKLIDKPYTGKQMDINKMMRNVWIFPIKPI